MAEKTSIWNYIMKFFSFIAGMFSKGAPKAAGSVEEPAPVKVWLNGSLLSPIRHRRYITIYCVANLKDGDVPILDRKGNIVAEREVDGGVEVIEAKLPAIVTCQKGLNEPRYASLKGIMMAKKKSIEEIAVDIGEAKIATVKMEYPVARKAGKIVGEGVDVVPELVRLLREEAKAI